MAKLVTCRNPLNGDRGKPQNQTKEGDNVKIDKMKLDLAMANMAYSAKELSQKCGVSQVTIVRITKGVQEARPGTVGKIAKALKVPVTDIIKNTAATIDNGKQGISEAK